MLKLLPRLGILSGLLFVLFLIYSIALGEVYLQVFAILLCLFMLGVYLTDGGTVYLTDRDVQVRGRFRASIPLQNITHVSVDKRSRGGTGLAGLAYGPYMEYYIARLAVRGSKWFAPFIVLPVVVTPHRETALAMAHQEVLLFVEDLNTALTANGGNG